MRPVLLERIIWSLLLIGAGVGLLLSNLNILSFDLTDLAMRFWPVFIVVIGIKMMFDALRQYRENGGWWLSLFFGGIITMVGWNLLAERVGFQEIGWSLIWEMILPVILILIGLRFLIGGKKRSGSLDDPDKRGFQIEAHINRKHRGEDPYDPTNGSFAASKHEARKGGRLLDEEEEEPVDIGERDEEGSGFYEREGKPYGNEGGDASPREEGESSRFYRGKSGTGSGAWSVYRERGKGWGGLFEGEGYYAEGRDHRRKFYKSALIGEIKMVRNLFELEDMSLWNGIGDVAVDFSKAKMADGETEVEIRGWIGDVKCYIPRELPVWLDVHVGLGDYRIFDEHQNGMGKTYTYRSRDYDLAARKLHLIIDYKIGDIKILDV